MTQFTETADAGRFSLRFYVHALTGMLGSPGRFFKELPDRIGYGQPFGFLLISSIFLTGASLTHIHEKHFLMAGIVFINAIGMVVISAGITFVVIPMVVRKRLPFSSIFAVYAFSSGVTMLVSWIPLFIWFTELWKWVLVLIGMVRGCQLTWKQALLVTGISLLVIVLFFWSVTPVIFYLKGLGGPPAPV